MRKTAALFLPSFVVLGLALAGCATPGTVSPPTAANVTVGPGSLTFAATTVGQTAASQTITVSNAGGTAATLQAPALGGANVVDFATSANTCTTTLAPSASCTIAISFTPTATGSRTATFTLPGVTQTVTLAGTGTAVANVVFNLTGLTFVATTVGQTASSQTVTATNIGGAAAAIQAPTLSGANAGDYAISATTCTTTLAPLASCTIAVSFAPAASGTRTATLSLPGTTQTATLTGTGNTVANVTLNSTSLTFAATIIGQTAASQTITVSNTGGTAATLQAAALSGANAGDFAISSTTCSTTLVPSASCAIVVSFTPTASGNRTATLTLPGATQTVTLNGTGSTAADVTFTATALTFNSTPINQSVTQNITVSNTGGTAATLQTPILSGSNATDFAISTTTCTTTLAASSTCSISITFTPTAIGTRTATISLGESSLGVNNTLTATLTGTGVTAALGLQGTVITGTQPISNATIQLYKVGSAGNGSVATALLTGSPITTNSAGNFYLASGSPLTLDFTCANSTDQVYAVANGGNPGLTPASTNNAAIVLMTALGNCGALSATSTITINEVTTAAAVWALNPFMMSATNVGSSSTNAAGIANAMLDAQLLANSSTGVAATVGSNLTVESGKLDGLADVLASCVESPGSTAACTSLFTAATPNGGTAPATTLAAALDIVKNPGENPGGVYALIPTSPAYATTLTQAPNDWTIALSITGITNPTALDIDRSGNVWVAGYNGILAEFSPQGAVLSPPNLGVGDLEESYGLTIDTTGNIWVSNQQSTCNGAGSVSKFLSTGTVVLDTAITNCGAAPGHPPYFYDSSIVSPISLSSAPNGHILIGNADSATIYTSAGAVVSPTGLGAADASSVTAIAADNSNGVWLANYLLSTVTHVASSGVILSNLSCCNGANGVAIDSANNAWIANYTGGTFSVISSSNTASPGDAVVIDGGPLVGSSYSTSPAGVAVDAGQNVWVANYHGNSISNLAGIHSASPLGTLLSPAAGYGYPSGDPNIPLLLLLPEHIVPDTSGNIWVTDFNGNKLVMFFGIATPTKMPIQPVPVAP